uniref:F-ATPase gamma subunit n=1 Tax=Chloropicon laureae TaxID=464258 RepID=A0A7S2Z181_9CHLO|mmetsp:Transcript_14128/g.36419  ORF Transcript_14128/g.36419 Transcript_14128/m.36419 type:complete len:362 (+) Transcript_14128:98-1183(+)|eukprot:CAMPEP_0197486878 /NCGR_PEP_ID=MMETSP1311-20131121/1852_1 /TAXON_ID=464262 /ORGANISM="Genus nov. species nov., Strain RCC856" /LENGTH=361 /DNA_ID=CAMNT_0043030213 /DNA_START=63 /DNA_END=1148 /DNA_ORIENTATION=+
MQAIGGRRANFVRGGRVGGTERAAMRVGRSGRLACQASLKDIRDRIGSVKNTQKITDAMKLVAAAKVRRAQDAVISGRPFASKLVDMLYGVNTRLRNETDVDSPLLEVKPVEKVLVVAFTGDRGLCGGFNNFILKRTEQRVAELKASGVEAELILVGKKGGQYFGRRTDQYEVVRSFETGQKPTVKESQAIADVIYSKFVGGEVQKVELIYTKFVSLISSDPIVQTLLPMTPEGEVCDVEGNCIDAADDELFKLTSSEGEFAVEREATSLDSGEGAFDELLIFEQEPDQILDALLPLYMNGTVLRALQESLASELAARMNAMNSASDNAKELKKNLTLLYNRGRQAKITGEIIEIVAGSSA